MTAAQLIHEVAGSSLVSVIVTSLLASFVGVFTFRYQSRERLDGAIAWQWTYSPYHSPGEEPFLVLQNRSASSAYLVRARLLKGVLFRTEARRYAFDYVEPESGNFPLEVRASVATSFPLSTSMADKIAEGARWYSRCLSYVLRRSYIWVEVTTITRERLTVSANDVTSFRDRPLWLTGRWLPES